MKVISRLARERCSTNSVYKPSRVSSRWRLPFQFHQCCRHPDPNTIMFCSSWLFTKYTWNWL